MYRIYEYNNEIIFSRKILNFAGILRSILCMRKKFNRKILNGIKIWVFKSGTKEIKHNKISTLKFLNTYRKEELILNVGRL